MNSRQKPEETSSEPRGTHEEATQADDDDWYWADPKALKVNPAFEALIPLQAKGEYRALDKSIQARGCLDPVEVWKGKKIVLDGHTRRQLCIDYKKQVKVREVDLPDEKSAVEYILQIQRQRRNLTREAMSYFRGAEYNAIKKLRGGNKRGRRPKEQSDPMVSTAQQLADKYGVSDMTIKRDAVFAHVIDKLVDDYGEPEVKRRLLGADVKLTQGLARQLLKMPAAEREAAVDQLLDQGEMPRGKKGGTAPAPKPKEVAQSIAARLQKKGEAHAKAVFKQLALVLGFEVTEKSSDK